LTAPNSDGNTKAGDLIQLVGLSYKSYIFVLAHEQELHTHRGVIKHNDLIGIPWGSQVFSHLGSPFFLLQPSLPDLIKNTPRVTQIMYPKDIGQILMTMGIGPGKYVIEAGTGSGGLTTALAYAVGDTGKIFSYEVKEEHQSKARKNLQRIGMADRVEFKIRNVVEGFDETSVDAVFLDMANSYDYIGQAKAALKPGGYFGSILPTTNQVVKLLVALRRYEFAFIDVCEMSMRYYKSEPLRFRPTDRMIAHTGFLIFARPIIVDKERMDRKLLLETGAISVVPDEEQSVEDDLSLSEES
jgi:tRNA (adenine57-N1/adenine58-N1)-methyltransferase catalytic subunit